MARLGRGGTERVIPVLPTQVAGLDEILGGGIPLRTLTLILGRPGAGKTILAEQIAVGQAKTGKRVLILTALSEAHEQMLASLRQFSFFDESLVGDRIRFLSIQTLLQDGLAATADAIIEIVRSHEATVVVLDGFRGVAGFAQSERDVRLFLYEVRARLALLDVTTLVTLEMGQENEGDSGAQTVADGIIRLHNSLWGVRHRRHIEVRKLRAMAHLDGLHTIAIDGDGLTCYPRHEAVYRTANYLVSPDRATIGLPELDAMLHGGLNRGTVTFLAGSPGSGKTLTALHYIMAGADAGEPGLFVCFTESEEQLHLKAEHFGLDLRGAIVRGMVSLLCIAPVELEVDIFAATLRHRVEHLGIRRLVIDSVAAVEVAILEPNRGPGFFAALINYLRERDVTSVMTQESNAFDGSLGESFGAIFADNLIGLRSVEYQDRLHRIVSILKMRQSGFDPGLREFRIEDGRIRVVSVEESGIAMMNGITAREQRTMRNTHSGGDA
ncbi:MAG: ATPase domain-containing protein [Thermomicrobiales bacterium]